MSGKVGWWFLANAEKGKRCWDLWQSRNERHAGAVWCNKTAGFEIVHGVLDRAMKMLEIPRISATDFKADTGYYLKETSGEWLLLKWKSHIN